MWRSSAHPDSDSQRRRRPPQRGGVRKGNKSDLKVSVWPGAAFHQLCFCTDSSVQMIHRSWRAVLAEGQSRSCELITGWQNTEEVLTIQMACVKKIAPSEAMRLKSSILPIQTGQVGTNVNIRWLKPRNGALQSFIKVNGFWGGNRIRGCPRVKRSSRPPHGNWIVTQR